jgi:hypothetical protein
MRFQSVVSFTLGFHVFTSHLNIFGNTVNTKRSQPVRLTFPTPHEKALVSNVRVIVSGIFFF